MAATVRYNYRAGHNTEFALLHFTIKNERDRSFLLTVTVSKHNAGVLPPQLQSHSLQITFGCCFFDQLAYLQTHRYIFYLGKNL